MKELTKEKLLELGVTSVTQDGTVYVNNKVKRSVVATCRHSNGNDKHYPCIQFYDKNVRKYYEHPYRVKDGTKRTSKWYTYKTITIPLGRIVLAWFTGKIASNMDADHIDNDPFNNSIDNLRAISRRENLAKRLLDHEGYEYTYFNQYHNLKNKGE